MHPDWTTAWGNPRGFECGQPDWHGCILVFPPAVSGGLWTVCNSSEATGANTSGMVATEDALFLLALSAEEARECCRARLRRDAVFSEW